MKTLLSIALFASLSAISLSGTNFTKVYICQSPTSYAYHKTLCKGLSQCTHKIDSVTLPEAKALGKNKACRYCYR